MLSLSAHIHIFSHCWSRRRFRCLLSRELPWLKISISWLVQNDSSSTFILTYNLTLCYSQVSCLALEGSLAVSGDLNGMLVAWDWRSGAVVAEKQMFGRIEALRLKGGFLATGHISKSYDTGCISIRYVRD